MVEPLNAFLTASSRIGIVNRGESAVRFIRALREYNTSNGTSLKAVAFYIEIEHDSVFVRMADSSCNLSKYEEAGPRSPYLNRELVLRAMKDAGCDAVWVGWGFLAEDADFARMIENAGLVFLGPSADSMALLGDKIAAKELAERADVPILPWSRGAVKSVEDAKRIASSLGYPVIVKAAHAGGGRGIRFVLNEREMDAQYKSAREETVRVTGGDIVFIELLVEKGRHLEVQGLCDAYGNVRTYGVRDCSIQRRNQKIIEETPPPNLDPSIATEIESSAARLLAEAGYRSAGTVEYLYDLHRKAFYFMEVNTRLQVEHPITEQLYGIDLVKGQIEVAMGVRFTEGVPAPRGVAIEVRLNAEDPDRDFVPAPGRVLTYKIPSGPGVRVDSGIREGSSIPQEFDSMIAKIIAYGSNRRETLSRLERSLRELRIKIENGTTNRAFLLELLRVPEVRDGSVHTRFVEELLDRGGQIITRERWDIALAAAAIELYNDRFAEDFTNFRYQLTSTGHPRTSPQVGGYEVNLSCRGRSYTVRVNRMLTDIFRLELDGIYTHVRYRPGIDDATIEYAGVSYSIQTVHRGDTLQCEVDGIPYAVEVESGGSVKAPSPAIVLAINVEAGRKVEKGDLLLSLEAMKMEMIVVAPQTGTVKEVVVSEGEQVAAGQPLVLMEAEDREGIGADESAEPTSFLVPELDVADRWLVLESSLQSLFLGFDFDEDPAALLSDMKTFVDNHPEYAQRFERSIISSVRNYISIEQLFSSEQLPTEEFARSVSWTELLFHYFRRAVDPERGMPARFLEGLDSALSAYAVAAGRDDDTSDEIVFRIHRSHSMAETKQDVVRAMLFTLEERGVAEPGIAELTALLDDLVTLTAEQSPSIADAAAYARYHIIDRHTLKRLKTEWIKRVERLLGEIPVLEGDDHSRLEKMEEITDAGSHVIPMLLRCSLQLDDPMHELALELLGRLFVRDRRIESLQRINGHDIVSITSATGEGDGITRFRTVLAVTGTSGLESVIEALSAHPVPTDPAETEVIVLINTDGTIAEEYYSLIGRLTFECRWCCMGIFDPLDNFSYRTFVPSDTGWSEDVFKRFLNPISFRELKVDRLRDFDLSTLYTSESVVLVKGTAKENPRDERFFALVTTAETDPDGSADDSIGRIVEFEYAFMEAVFAMRAVQARRKYRLQWNRIIVHNRSLMRMNLRQIKEYGMRLLPRTRDLGLEKMVVYSRRKRWREDMVREIELVFLNISEGQFTLRSRTPSAELLDPVDRYVSNVIRARQRGNVYPYELVKMLTLSGFPAERGIPRGEFEEYDLVVDPVTGRQTAVSVKGREPGGNTCNIVFGIITSYDRTRRYGYKRALILSDATSDMGTLAEPECRRVIAAIDLAEQMDIPVEWVPVSSGAKIDMDSGTENLDWTAVTLKRIVEFTQSGGEINIIVSGINVGAQSYWNAEATMLMHTRGLLVMTDEASMLLTGKKALDFSGSVSAKDNVGIGGVETIMGPNGEAQVRVKNLTSAYEVLFKHYHYTYTEPGNRFPERLPTADPADRDIGVYPYRDTLGQGFEKIGDIFALTHNPERKKPFDMRQVMEAVIDQDMGWFERWGIMRDAETAIVWETRVGGFAVGMIGIESRSLVRFGEVPHDGPESWSGGTLFPLSSKKVARAVNAFSGRLPLVILANLSGFDGSPESLRRLQLEYGAEIGRAIVNFHGPIVFVVIARYHGGAYVVFSRSLHPQLKAAALEGSYASVIGGAPAAAVVFPRLVAKDTLSDPRITDAQSRLTDGSGFSQKEFDDLYQKVYTEKQTALGQSFDRIHSVERAKKAGSIHDIITVSELRPYVVSSVDEGIRAYLESLESIEKKSECMPVNSPSH